MGYIDVVLTWLFQINAILVGRVHSEDSKHQNLRLVGTPSGRDDCPDDYCDEDANDDTDYDDEAFKAAFEQRIGDVAYIITLTTVIVFTLDMVSGSVLIQF